jgi:helicase
MDPPPTNTSQSRQTPPQAHVLEAKLLETGFNCILQMPTGSGKTWLAEQAIARTLHSGQRAVYLTPLRALAEELVQKWKPDFSPAKVGVFTGDYGAAGRSYPIPFVEAQLLVMTPERLDACTRAWRSHWKWIPEVDLVVVDEVHLLGDQHRGARLEGALSRFLRLNPFARILALSATLGNRVELAQWLDGVEFGSDWRPVKLEWTIVPYRKADQKPELLLEEVVRNLKDGGKSLVFVQSRRRAEALSSHLQTAGLRAAHHHAGLTHGQRRDVESRFREHDVDVLVATSTVEMGLNLPVRQVVLYDLQGFDGTEFRPLSTNTVWQRAGRAGRPGLDRQGEVVLLAPRWDRSVERYPAGQFEPIRSQLADSRLLAEQIIAEVASGLARTRAQLMAVLDRSLAAHQKILPVVSSVVTEMLLAGMLEEIDDDDREALELRLRTTRLGFIACRHLVEPSTVLLFRHCFDTHPDLTFFDLLLLAASTRDCEPILPVDFEEIESIGDALRLTPSRLLRMSQMELGVALEIRARRLLAAVKMALVLRRWTTSGNVDETATEQGCYPFEIQRSVESMCRLLLVMEAVLGGDKDAERDEGGHLDGGFVALRERVRILHRMVHGGFDEITATLTLVPGIGPKTARKLQDNDILDIEALAKSEPEDLKHVRGVSFQRAGQWIELAQRIAQSDVAYRYREIGASGLELVVLGASRIDPYRLGRAKELKVSGTDGGIYRVSGGLEPHLVQIASGHCLCDCVDAAKGHECKHQLAVRLHRGDRGLRSLLRDMANARRDARLDLFQLWYEK